MALVPMTPEMWLELEAIKHRNYVVAPVNPGKYGREQSLWRCNIENVLPIAARSTFLENLVKLL